MKQFMYLAAIAIGVIIIACNETTGNTVGGDKKTDYLVCENLALQRAGFCV